MHKFIWSYYTRANVYNRYNSIILSHKWYILGATVNMIEYYEGSSYFTRDSQSHTPRGLKPAPHMEDFFCQKIPCMPRTAVLKFVLSCRHVIRTGLSIYIERYTENYIISYKLYRFWDTVCASSRLSRLLCVISGLAPIASSKLKLAERQPSYSRGRLLLVEARKLFL